MKTKLMAMVLAAGAMLGVFGATIDLAKVTTDTVAQDGDTLTGYLGANVKISIAAGATVTLNGVRINGVSDDSYAWAGINCEGDATIVLLDYDSNRRNTVNGFCWKYPGIHVPAGCTLTIQGGNAELNASSNGEGAGIGGGTGINCGNIVISGGTINATGGYSGGAGIGSGCNGAVCGNITISGGTVTATGGNQAPGIGSGKEGSVCSNITISAGTVTATGGNEAVGIGGGYYGAACGDITISGGMVVAKGGSYSAGIGSSGTDSICGDITISDGAVTATGGYYAAGIGAGSSRANCGNIVISGGTVTATGGNSAPGIGSGTYYAKCGNITIDDTVTLVTATKGERAPNCIGEGGDVGSTCGTVTVAEGLIDTTEGATRTIMPTPPTSLFEDFEGGVMPDGWTCETSWNKYFNVGLGDDGAHTGSHGGQYNARVPYDSSKSIKLVTPVVDLSAAAEPVLNFWFVNRHWGPSIDELNVCYRTSVAGEWQTITNFPTAHESWTECTIALENPSATYQVAFEYVGHYGHGVGVDDVSIKDATPPPDPDQIAADAVAAAIDAIGDVAYTDESKAKIDAARAAYDTLTDEQKALVTNYATLTAAEAAYAALAPAPVEPEPEPAPAPEPTPCYVVIDEADIVAPYDAPKAVTLVGVVYDGCDVVGIMELKLGKVNAKKGTSKVSGSVTTLDGKKHTAKGVTVIGIDGSAPAVVTLEVKDLGTMAVTIGGTQFAGSLGAYHVQSADVGGAWAGGSAVAAVEPGDLSVFAGTVLVDSLPTNEVAAVSNGKWTFKKAASVKWAKAKGASEKSLIVDTSKGTNLSGLKLTYTPKKGTFKGSFSVYALEGAGSAAKLKKYKMNVTGVVVGGVGYGVATSKKPAVSWPVVVQ